MDFLPPALVARVRGLASDREFKAWLRHPYAKAKADAERLVEHAITSSFTPPTRPVQEAIYDGVLVKLDLRDVDSPVAMFKLQQNLVGDAWSEAEPIINGVHGVDSCEQNGNTTFTIQIGGFYAERRKAIDVVERVAGALNLKRPRGRNLVVMQPGKS